MRFQLVQLLERKLSPSIERALPRVPALGTLVASQSRNLGDLRISLSQHIPDSARQIRYA